jgi:hypothetical protein
MTIRATDFLMFAGECEFGLVMVETDVTPTLFLVTGLAVLSQFFQAVFVGVVVFVADMAFMGCFTEFFSRAVAATARNGCMLALEGVIRQLVVKYHPVEFDHIRHTSLVLCMAITALLIFDMTLFAVIAHGFAQVLIYFFMTIQT